MTRFLLDVIVAIAAFIVGYLLGGGGLKAVLARFVGKP